MLRLCCGWGNWPRKLLLAKLAEEMNGKSLQNCGGWENKLKMVWKNEFKNVFYIKTNKKGIKVWTFSKRSNNKVN